MKLRVAIVFCLIIGVIGCEHLVDSSSTEDPRDVLLGQWNQYENVGDSPYEVKIEKEEGSKFGIIILGFNTIPKLMAKVIDGELIIPKQKILSGMGNEEVFEGLGIVNDVFVRIDLNYKNDNVPSKSYMVPFRPSEEITSY